MIERLQFKPIARRNHLAFSLVGLLSIISALILQQFEIKLPGYILMLFGFLFFLFGVFKWQEPPISLELNEQGLIWYHKFGVITLDWENIIDIVPLQVNKGQGQTELHYFGIKVWDRAPMIRNIAPRLAKSLFHEYRSLLHVALLEAQFRSDDTSFLQEDSEHWKAADGQIFDGLKGMFAARLHQLKHYLGADLFVPLTALDRNQEDFLVLFKQYRSKLSTIKSNKTNSND